MIQRILAQLRQIALPPVEFAFLMFRRFVVQLSIMTGDAELLDQTEHGEQLRVVEKNFRENFIVEQIQAPWSKPNEVDQEYGDDDREDRDNRANPFQSAL